MLCCLRRSFSAELFSFAFIDYNGNSQSNKGSLQYFNCKSHWAPSPPAFDSFAWLAIGLSVAVGAGTAYYFRKSKQQLEGTLKTLEGRMNQ
jgi:hypothetical protein